MLAMASGSRYPIASSTATSSVEHEEADTELDAGARFVLKSLGSWVHCGYHLSTSIVAPALLSLPFAFAFLGWDAGIMCLILGALVTFYSYNLISAVLEHRAAAGKRHLRFRDMATEILGPGWGRYFVGPIQFMVCYGAVVGSTLLGGQCMKVYLQPTNEVLERGFADPKSFSIRNVAPRVISRSLSVIIATTIAAMLPFFGDLNALIGAFGFIPLDFVLPVVCFNLTFKPSLRKSIFWVNVTIAVVFSAVGVIAAVAAVRQITIDVQYYKIFADV